MQRVGRLRDQLYKDPGTADARASKSHHKFEPLAMEYGISCARPKVWLGLDGTTANGVIAASAQGCSHHRC